MKKLILCLLLFGFISSGHSQILLKEANVDLRQKSLELDPNTNTLVLQLPEKAAGEFQKDPLTFMRNNFDVQKFITDNRHSEYNTFLVNFKSSKGFFIARIDRDGELLSSLQKFKDVRLPENVRLEILSQYRDALLLGNKYIASTRGWEVDKAYYKVKIKEGDKTRRLRIDKDREMLSLTGQ